MKFLGFLAFFRKAENRVFSESQDGGFSGGSL